MIISASRRTDIPNYYSEWFYQQIKEGFCYVRNPMNPHQVSRISLSPDVVDGIVFWTKNPEPMMDRLKELQAYPYYFQFTLTGYGKDLERGIPHKKNDMIPIFQRLSGMLGSRRVVWRYDPILFTERYTPDYHRNAFATIAGALRGYTDQCVISFVDIYRKNKKNMEHIHASAVCDGEFREFVRYLSETAQNNGMKITACAEHMDLSDLGIGASACIDKERIEEISGFRIKARKDKNQRPECGCMESVEIGAYDTCKNGCLYCYANTSSEKVRQTCQAYDVNSPLLCGVLLEEDKVTEREMRSLREGQLDIRDIIERIGE